MAAWLALFKDQPWKHRIWVLLIATTLSSYMSWMDLSQTLRLSQRPSGVTPIPSWGQIHGLPRQEVQQMVSIQIASGTVVKTLAQDSGIPQQENLLTYMFHNAAGQKALLEGSYENLDRMKKLIQTQDSRIQLLLERMEAYEKASKAAVESAKTEAAQTAVTAQASEESKKLAKLIGALPNAKAVSMLQEMDDKMVSAVLSQMKEPEAAKLLSGFPAKRAALISLRMAEPKRP